MAALFSSTREGPFKDSIKRVLDYAKEHGWVSEHKVHELMNPRGSRYRGYTYEELKDIEIREFFSNSSNKLQWSFAFPESKPRPKRKKENK